MLKENFLAIAYQAHKIGVEHGFWKTPYSDVHCLMLVVTELAEAIEADREGRRADREAYERGIEAGKYFGENFRHDTDWYRQSRPDVVFERYIKDTLEDELADAVIRLADLTEARGIDFPQWDIIEQRQSFVGPGAFAMGDTLPEILYRITQKLTGLDSLKVRIPEAVLSVFYLAEYLGFDLLLFIDAKLLYNNCRKWKHGKKY